MRTVSARYRRNLMHRSTSRALAGAGTTVVIVAAVAAPALATTPAPSHRVLSGYTSSVHYTAPK